MAIPVQVKPRGARSGPARDVVRALAGVDPPMFAVTTSLNGVRAGCLVGFVTQCSVNPVRYLVCLANANHTARVAAGADLLAVHALGVEHHGLAALFATTTEVSVTWPPEFKSPPPSSAWPCWIVNPEICTRPLKT